ncbi:hypothetical protein P3G55_18955, partial [Leptospira sp. 96542]|nr:hypothetical protein [Leptospira sp. 96542]
MIDDRRSMIRTLAATGLTLGSWGTGALRALASLGLYSGGAAAAGAQTSQRPIASRSPAFQAETPADALRHILGAAPVVEVGEQQIQLQVPELAENGAMVPVTVNSL